MHRNILWSNVLENIHMEGVRITLRCLETVRYEDLWRMAAAQAHVQRPLFGPSVV